MSLHDIFLEAENLDGTTGINAVKQALKHGYQINEQDEEGYTLLHMIAVFLHEYFRPHPMYCLNTITQLVELGADPTIQNNLQETFIDLYFSDQIKVDKSFDKLSMYPNFINLFGKHSAYANEIFSVLNHSVKLDPDLINFAKLSDQIDIDQLSLDCSERMVKWIDQNISEAEKLILFNLCKRLEVHIKFRAQDKLKRQGLFVELLQKQTIKTDEFDSISESKENNNNSPTKLFS